MMNKTGLTFLLILISVATFATGYTYERNVPYRENAGDEYISKMCRLDIAYQPDVQNAPVVVWFHGGGLTGWQPRSTIRAVDGRYDSRRCRIPLVTACGNNGDRG